MLSSKIRERLSGVILSVFLAIPFISPASPPVLVDADEAARDGKAVAFSPGWTSRYTKRQLEEKKKVALNGLTGAEKQAAKDDKRAQQEYSETNCVVAVPSFQARPNLYFENDFTTSGMGYGADGGDEGAGEFIEFTTTDGIRSVSALFLNHMDGQVAELYVDGEKVRDINTFSTGGAPSGATRGVCGQMVEEVLATGLSSGPHKIRIVNTGRVEGPAAEYKGRTDRAVGRQIIVDCFRTGDFNFGTIEGVITDENDQPLPQVRLLLDSYVGPIVENGKTVIFTNGDGEYRISGLERGKSYTLSSDDRRVTFSESLAVPEDNDGVLLTNIDTSNSVNVMRPRMGIPAIVERGDTFTIEADGPETASDWTVTISNEDISVDLQVVSAKYGPDSIYNNTRKGWVITAQIPDSGITRENSGAPCEIYDIRVGCSTGQRTEPRAVSVIEDYDKSFYIAQLTDTHIAAGTANLTKSLQILDILGPRFVAITGDLVQLPGQPQLFDVFQDLVREHGNVPTVITTGNHDVTIKYDEFQLTLWDTLFAQREFSFRMGPVYVMVHNVTSPTKDWALGEWDRAYANADDKVRMILQHSARAFDGFIPPADKPATIALGGHNHKDTCNVLQGTTVVTTRATTGSGSSRIVRFDNEGGQWKLRSFAYPNKSLTEGAAEEEYPSFVLFKGGEKGGDDIGEEMVTRNYSAANDGTATTNSATIVNKSEEPLEYCRARFEMAKGAYKIGSGNGRIVNSYDTQRGSTVVLAEMPVDAASTATMEIVKE